MRDIFNELSEAIADGDEELSVEEAKKLIDAGVAPLEIFGECIQETLNDVGEKFSRLEIFLPDLMMAGDAVTAVQNELLPLMKGGENRQTQGRVVIGTAYGDLHDIGKNMVSLMLEVNGFEVKDLGVNVGANDFVNAARDFNADIIAISALMLPTMPYMQDTIEIVNADPAMRSKTKIMVGGGPISQAWADEVGADGYSDDAMDAVNMAKKLMEQLKAAS